jgi:hypothetical protein
MLERGFEDCARICLTHSFPIKQADAYASRWNCPAEQKQFVQEYLDRAQYTAYDRLIQLYDALALPSGPVLMEKRLVDVALRWGFNDHTLPKCGRHSLLFGRSSPTRLATSLPSRRSVRLWLTCAILLAFHWMSRSSACAKHS